MTLDGVASSDDMKAFVASFAQALHDLRRNDGGTGRRAPSKPFRKALAAILCDLMRAAAHSFDQWSYRPTSRGSFSGQSVGYRGFQTAIAALVHSGYVDRQGGHQQRSTFDPSSIAWSMATRFRSTPKLLMLLDDASLSPASWEDHFTIMPVDPAATIEPIVCRLPNVRIAGRVVRQPPSAIDRDNPVVKAIYDRMANLNKFYAGHTISPFQHLGFRRVFNEGGAPDYGWNKGGRIVSFGDPNYQSAKRHRRAKMLIDGLPVVEIDIRASHLTILYGLLSVPFDACASDPYVIDGIPRSMVKTWITMTLGHSQYHTRWPGPVTENLERELNLTCRLQEAYPLASVKSAILSKHPVLDAWDQSSVTWADLQFTESEVILGTMERLAYQHGIISYPVHDSLIVPKRDRDIAKKVLGDIFTRHAGLSPHLS